MKAVIVSDLQAAQHGVMNEEGISLWFLDLIKELKRIFHFCVREEVTHFIVLGDVFHERGSLDVPVLNMVHQAIKQFADFGIEVIILVGNHDWDDLGKHHSLEVFKPFCRVISSPERFKSGGLEIVAIPYLPKYSNISAALKQLQTPNTDLVLLHCGIKGYVMHTGYKWEEGVELHEIRKRKKDRGLVSCFIGHYHQFEKLRKECFFVGSLFRVDWSDVNKDKYFAYYQPGKPTMFFETQGPRFVKVFTSTGDISHHLEPLICGAYVKVDFKGSLDGLGAVKERILRMGARYVEVEDFNNVVSAISEAPSSNIKLPELVESYVEGSDTHLDKGKLLKVGLSTLEEASSSFKPS